MISQTDNFTPDRHASSDHDRATLIAQLINKHQEQKEAFLKACTLARRTAETFLKYSNRSLQYFTHPAESTFRGPETKVKSTSPAVLCISLSNSFSSDSYPGEAPHSGEQGPGVLDQQEEEARPEPAVRPLREVRQAGPRLDQGGGRHLPEHPHPGGWQ